MATLTVPAAVKAASLSVLCVHNRYIQPGGEDQVFESEAQLLADHGARVEKVEAQTTYPDGLVRKIGAAADCVWSRSWHQEFKARLRQFRPDVVHIHNFFSVISPSVYYACREEGVPVVQTLHNYRLACPAASFYRDGKICEECLEHGPFHAVRYGCYRESKLATAALATMLEVHRRKHTWTEMVDCYVALTEFVRDKMIQAGLPAEKIRVKPNFVLPDPGPRTGEGDYALFVGRLVDLKGVGTLIQAWSQLPSSIPLVIAGDGPFRPQMEKLISDLKLENVHYRGRLSRKETLATMKGARFLMFPSEWYEGFPVTIAESFACGVPVLCSRLGGMREIVEDGRTGMHFTAGDASDVAAKAQWAWSHPEEISAMGLGARAEFEAKYSAERNFRMLTEIYDSVISRGASHGPAVGTPGEQRLAERPLLSDKERHRVLVEWNATEAAYPREKCIHELIEARAGAEPDAIAVAQGSNKLTYCELNQRANQLAHYLRRRGVGPEVPVGVCLENSMELPVALLAVLKAGGACLPLDPAYPLERLQWMLEDSQAPVLVSREGLLPELDGTSTQRMCLLTVAEELEKESRANPQPLATPASLAYVIYTSGSTGKPKGVMLTHGGLVNYIWAAIKLYSLGASDRVLQFSSISFDIAIEEIFPTWAAGATLVLRSGSFSLAGPDFLHFAWQQKLSVISVATAYWHELVHELSESNAALPETVRLVVVGGEKAQVQAFEAWRKLVGNRVRWINTYGPTETSVIASSCEPPAAGPVPSPLPIGRPISNVKMHILDRNLQLVPVGVAGELYIGGPGVARGYLNRPDLTAERFVPDPFSTDPAARLYRTGDLASYLDNGEIEFVGRRDFQVKIRGFRVELGEIEAALTKHATVREALVIAREEGLNHRRLVGYVIPAAGAVPDAGDLRKFLKQQLPEYMVPSDFVVLAEFPLTPNGKVDRNALPAPLPSAQSADHVAPSNPVEAQLAAMWEEILAKKPISVRDNFFDLGGHSLLAVRLMRRMEQSFRRKLPLTTLFEAPTIEQFAALLQQERWTPSQASLVPIQPQGTRPPFFCVHGLGGTVLRFNALARFMGTDRPFYGVQAQGLEGDCPFHTSVEEMAAFYLKEIRALQPNGPYHIGGYSLGGLIAFEMARQLQADRQEVGVLALFDTYPGKPKSNKVLLRTLLKLPREQQVAYLTHRAKRIQKGIKRRFEAFFLPRPLKEVRKVFAVAEQKYRPQVYFGSATWFRASEKGLRGVDGPNGDWSKWVRGGVHVYEIVGDHGSILREPDVRLLAERLRNCLNQAEAAGSTRQLQEQNT